MAHLGVLVGPRWGIHFYGIEQQPPDNNKSRGLRKAGVPPPALVLCRGHLYQVESM